MPKRGFFDSDDQFRSGSPEDKCLEELLKAIDTAKTLERSLQGENTAPKDNAKRFINFIYHEVPSLEASGLNIELVHSRTGKTIKYDFGELAYEIRRMIHENENLNVAEGADYHMLLDWNKDAHPILIWSDLTRAVIGGHFLLGRLRQIMSKFLTFVDGVRTMHETGKFSCRINAPLQTIRPQRGSATQ